MATEALLLRGQVSRLVMTGLATAAATSLISLGTGLLVRRSLEGLGLQSFMWDGVIIALAALTVFFLSASWFKARAFQKEMLGSLAGGDVVTARVAAARAREQAWIAIGWSIFILLVLAFIWFIFMNDVGVGRTFFLLPLMYDKWGLIAWRFFSVNVVIMLAAEVLVLAWGLVVALARLTPGRAGKPIRALAILYCDVFRGLPSIVTLYLIGFGIPRSGIPDLFIPHIYALFADTSRMTPDQLRAAARIPEMWWCILGLTLTYGAYVAEVYRAGLESIHASQVSAARSLGLSHLQTMRYVVVPQAVRRIVAPLLNDFIGLQKDTALVQVVGVIDAFGQAKIIASNSFNLSGVTVVAILFVAITIPQARLADRLLERDASRMRSRG